MSLAVGDIDSRLISCAEINGPELSAKCIASPSCSIAASETDCRLCRFLPVLLPTDFLLRVEEVTPKLSLSSKYGAPWLLWLKSLSSVEFSHCGNVSFEFDKPFSNLMRFSWTNVACLMALGWRPIRLSATQTHHIRVKTKRDSSQSRTRFPYSQM